MGDTPTIEDFRVEAAGWLAEHRGDAPRDYGAICPPELIEAGIDVATHHS